MNVIVFGIIWQVANKTILFSTFLLPPPSPLWRNALPCLSNSSLLIQLTLDISWHGTSKGQKYVCVMWFLFCIPAFCHDKQNKTKKNMGLIITSSKEEEKHTEWIYAYQITWSQPSSTPAWISQLPPDLTDTWRYLHSSCCMSLIWGLDDWAAFLLI